MKKAWWKESVVYQIYPRSFCDSNGDGIGDLNGITSKMDYLKKLGIDVIWLSPVYQSPNADNGYDISDYQAIMTEFGTMEDYDRMLKSAHEHGIRIVMDLVVNHTSDEHRWFVESRGSKNNPKRDFYIWRDPVDGHEPNNWGSCFSGPAWKFDEMTGQYYLHLFADKQPDLNWVNPEVRKAVFDMMTWWCEKGIDGFRMDVISLISKPDGMPDAPTHGGLYGDPNICANGPHVHEYLQEMRNTVLSKYDLMTVGETAGVTLDEAKKYANSEGTELNMVFQFEHVGLDDEASFKWSTKKMPLVPLKKNLSKWQNGLDGVAWNSLYFQNHDQPRIISRLGNDSDEFREVSAKCIATCLHMMQGTPYVYEGEELGMSNYPWTSVDEFNDLESINAFHELTEKAGWDPEKLFPMIAHKSRDNARTPMQWDDSVNAGFTTGTPWLRVNPNYTKVNAKEQVNREDSVFHYYRKLIELRHSSELIVYGHNELLLPEDPDLFVYRRYLEDGQELICVCNFSEHERSFELPEALKAGHVLIQNIEGHDVKDGLLAPYEAYVVEK
ncbi:glycoside hydrolase family 13 protein [Chordicoccus furentiruminis]|uniref:glycoside hydrolase family 13 protein n=1 Tax=Chordicoccus furentiruminis TaxID=2709410 RepID=UPI0023A905F2|nr:alpha-glucosidase [Chordicoccus furentiruminis]